MQHAPTANLPVPVGASIRAAPIHAPHPYTRNPTNTFSNKYRSYSIANAKSVTDVTNAETLFYVGQSGKLSCRCCIGGNGFNIPATVYRITVNTSNRRTLSDEWRNFKNISAVILICRRTNSIDYYQRQGLRPAYTSANTKAGLTLIRMVYENVKTHRSYSSFRDSCAVRFIGEPIGFQNHSPQFPAAIVDCSFDVLKGQMSCYLCAQTPFVTVLPFVISSDKDRSKKRSRQLTGLRFASFDANYEAPFVNTAYIATPRAKGMTAHT